MHARERAPGSPGLGAGLRALLAAWLLLGAPAPAGAELSLGVTGGAVLAGDQDVQVEELHPGAPPSTARVTHGVAASAGPLAGVTATLWGANLGLQLEGLHWRTSIRVDAPAGGGARRRIGQARGAVLLSALGRLHFRERGGAYAYLGAGGGIVATDLDPGPVDAGVAVGALGGLAFPVTAHVRLRVEVRYLLVADAAGELDGRRVEMSGGSRSNPGRFLFGPHRDTQFVPILVGLDWVFR